jgi:Domain of unknown function (DUF4386)
MYSRPARHIPANVCGCCIVLGYLIFESGFFPRFLGVLMAVAGLSYVVISLATILSPSVAAALFPAILLPAFVGELSFALWLAVRGWTPRGGGRPQSPTKTECPCSRV